MLERLFEKYLLKETITNSDTSITNNFVTVKTQIVS